MKPNTVDTPSDHLLSGPGALSEADAGEPWPDDAPHPFATAEQDRYEHRCLVAEGAMGRVDRVYDRRLRREVALKTPRTPSAAARLAQEAWITAQLDHPGIVAVHDAGTSPVGLPFYSMRLVRGRTLEDALAAAGDLQGRLSLLRHALTACEAVAYAHGMGIVHRDLKPQNIMVGDLGETLVVDWGLARPAATATGAAWGGDMLPEGLGATTLAGAVVGTPAYMSPEQSLGTPSVAPSDVWSLGAILYRLVAGAPPFGVGVAADILQRLRAGAPPGVERAAPGVPPELAAIVTKALTFDPAERYPSARELAADLESYLEGRRVSAHEYRPAELLRRLARAWRAPLLVGVVALAALAVLGGLSVKRTAAERDRAVDAEGRASAALRRSDEQLADTLVLQAQREAAAGQQPEAELAAAQALTRREDPTARGVLMAFAGPTATAADVRAAPGCERLVLSASGRLALCMGEDASVWRLDPLERLWSAPIVARSGGFTAEGTVAIGDWEGRVHLLGADGTPQAPPSRTEKAEVLVAGHGMALVLWGGVVALAGTDRAIETACDVPHTAMAAATGPRLFAVVCSDGAVLVGSPASPGLRRIASVGPDVAGSALALLPGERLAMLHDKGWLTVLSLADGAVLLSADTGLRGASALVASPDGGLLAGLSTHGAVRVLDAATGREVQRLPAEHSRAAAWGPDGLVTASGSSVVRWALPTEPVARQVGEGAGLATIAVTRDGSLIALGRGDGLLQAWHGSGALAWEARFGDQVVKRLAVSPDGRRLYVAAMSEPGVAVLDAATGAALGRLGEQVNRRLAVLADGTVIAASWSLPPEAFTAQGAPIPGPAAGRTLDLDADPTGARVAVLEERTGRVLWWPGDERVGEWPGATAVAAGPGMGMAVSAGGRVILVSAAGERVVPMSGATVTDLAFTGDGRLVVALLDGSARVLTPGGEALATLRGHAERIGQVVTLPGALVTGSWDGTARRWGLEPLDAPPEQLLREVQARWGEPVE